MVYPGYKIPTLNTGWEVGVILSVCMRYAYVCKDCARRDVRDHINQLSTQRSEIYELFKVMANWSSYLTFLDLGSFAEFFKKTITISQVDNLVL